jgi:uncharacterized protein YaaQ
VKLLICIVHNRDKGKIVDELVRAGFKFTIIGSTGGFLREGNTTFLIGVDEDEVPAVLKLIHHTLRTSARLHKPVAVCGEMAGDARMTKLLLGLGLRSFSMHPAHLLHVKQQILRSDLAEITPLAARLLRAGQPERIQACLERLNA